MFMKQVLAVLVLGYFVSGITEDMDAVSLQDASHTKDRPTLVGYDFTEEEKATLENTG